MDTHQVTFKVEPNNLGMNASEVAEAIGKIIIYISIYIFLNLFKYFSIGNLKDKIKTEIGVEVTNVGIGYKVRF